MSVDNLIGFETNITTQLIRLISFPKVFILRKSETCILMYLPSCPNSCYQPTITTDHVIPWTFPCTYSESKIRSLRTLRTLSLILLCWTSCFHHPLFFHLISIPVIRVGYYRVDTVQKGGHELH